MSIKTRLTMAFLFAALIPVCFVGFFSMIRYEVALKESIGARFEEIAWEKADAISRVLKGRILTTHNLAALPLVINAIAEANRRYAGMDENEIRETIMRNDGEWIASGGKTPEADKVLNNPLSTYLKSYQVYNLSNIGEIFVTDRQGATVAMTGMLSDYYQADEQWWTGAMGEGVFIDDRGFDLSANAVIIGVVVLVKERGETIGILKINFRIGEIFDIVTRGRTNMGERLILARSNGVIIIENSNSRERLSDKEMGHLSDKKPDHKHYFTDEHSDWKGQARNNVITLEGHAAVEANIFTRIPSPNAIKGVSGERWEPTTWNLFVEVNQAEVFAEASALRQMFMAVVVAVLIGSAVIWMWISHSISRPILALRKDAEIIGSGNLDHRINVHIGDEVGALSQSFNQMASHLEKTLASRDELNREIEGHKRTYKALKRERNRAEGYLEIAEAMIIGLDLAGTVTMINRRGCEVLGYAEDEIIGRNWFDTVIPEDQREEISALHAKAMAGDVESIEHFEKEVCTKGGKRCHIAWHNTLISDDDGSITGSLSSGQDITERKKAEGQIKASLEEKEVLLKEIHHRVKNNLTVISGMLEIQADAEDDAHTEEVLLDSYRRVMLMAQIHESLHRQGDLNVIDASDFLNTLVTNTKASAGAVSENLSFHVDVDDIPLDVDHANAYGQIVSELISNSQKHGFPNGQPGNVEVSLHQKNGEGIELIVADDGKGLPKDFDFEQTKSLGLKLVRSLAAKFGGEIKFDGAGGTRVEINFPEQPS